MTQIERFKPAHNCKSCEYRGPIQFKDKHECSYTLRRESLGFICSNYKHIINQAPILKSFTIRQFHANRD